jgi:Fe-S-cluster-containing hydrogenase component 2
MKRIIVHPEKCLGCLACETACVTAHRLPGAPLTTEVNECFH